MTSVEFREPLLTRVYAAMTPAQFLLEYETSGRTGGVEATLKLIDEQAIYWFSDGTAYVGKAAVRESDPAEL